MPIHKLTDRFILSAKYKGKTVEYVDGDGKSRGMRFEIKKTRKIFSILYVAPDGKRKRFKIGSYPAITLKEARIRYLKLLSQIESGIDPAHARDQQRKKAKANKNDKGLTFEELSEKFMKRHAETKLAPKTCYEYRRQLKADLLPFIGEVRVDKEAVEDDNALTKRQIIECLDRIIDRGAPVKANRVASLVKKIMSWGFKEDHTNYNPAHGIPARHIERARKRVLTDDEIRTFWFEFGDGDVTEPVAIAAKLELVLGQRTSEITSIKKSRLILGDSPTLSIPDTKNKLDHKLPLPSLAVELINRAMKLSPGHDYLFPAKSKKSMRPIHPAAVSRAVGRQCDRLGFYFTSHDLRRTFNTRLSEMKINKDMRKRIMNHKSASDDVNERVYNWYMYEREMRIILENWCIQLTAIIENTASEANIVPFATPSV